MKNVSIESIKLLRDQAHKNVKKYCENNKLDFKAGLKIIVPIRFS